MELNSMCVNMHWFGTYTLYMDICQYMLFDAKILYWISKSYI